MPHVTISAKPMPIFPTNVPATLSPTWNKHPSDNSTFASERSDDAVSPAIKTSVTAPANDYRVTIRWTQKNDFHALSKKPTSWLTKALTLLKGLFTSKDGALYRWERKDLTQSCTFDQK
jgi:hypothetical protein